MAARAGGNYVRLVLDHHYPRIVSELLIAAGHRAETAIGREWHELDDAALLSACADDGAILVTNNVGDFVVIARQWQLEAREHAGLIFTSDTSWPRTRDGAGLLARAIDTVLRAHHVQESWSDRVHWL